MKYYVDVFQKVVILLFHLMMVHLFAGMLIQDWKSFIVIFLLLNLHTFVFLLRFALRMNKEEESRKQIIHKALHGENSSVLNLESLNVKHNGYSPIIQCRAILAYQNHIITFSADGCIQIWNIHTQKVLITIRCFAPSCVLAIDNDSRVVVLGGADGNIVFLFILI
jgi:WD40 repeat protein